MRQVEQTLLNSFVCRIDCQKCKHQVAKRLFTAKINMADKYLWASALKNIIDCYLITTRKHGYLKSQCSMKTWNLQNRLANTD